MLVMSALAVRYGNAFDCPAILFRNEMKTKMKNEMKNTSRLYRNIFIILTGIFWIGHISQYSTQLMNIASNFADNQE